MRKHNRKKMNSSRLTPSPREDDFSPRSSCDYSPPTLAVEGSQERFYSISLEVQVTIQALVELSRSQIVKLASISLSLIREKGISLSDWMILEFLYSSLLGSKQEPLEIKDNREKELITLLKVVLLSGTWIGLEEKRQLPLDVQKAIDSTPFIPKGRVLGSWLNYWKIDKFLKVRIVPLDTFLERSRNTSPYSSYCKGYGESSRMGRRKKTRASAELDGEPVNLEEDGPKVPLFAISRFLTLSLLETKYTQNTQKLVWR